MNKTEQLFMKEYFSSKYRGACVYTANDIKKFRRAEKRKSGKREINILIKRLA